MKDTINHTINSLHHSNKIHNFTSTELDNNIELLNKGTSFIHTFSYFNKDNIKTILSSEISSNLNQIISTEQKF